MHPDQPVPVPGLTRKQSQRWAAVQPQDNDRILVGDSPERAAVVTTTRMLSYGELAARAYGIAERLKPLGLCPNELVAVVMEKGWEQCAAVLGILAAGVVLIVLGLFVEERALQIPRLYDDDSLR